MLTGWVRAHAEKDCGKTIFHAILTALATAAGNSSSALGYEMLMEILLLYLLLHEPPKINPLLRVLWSYLKSSSSELNIRNYTALLKKINTTDPQPLASVGRDTFDFFSKLVVNQLQIRLVSNRCLETVAPWALSLTCAELRRLNTVLKFYNTVTTI